MTVQSPQAQEILSGLLRGFSGAYWIGLRLPDGHCPDAAASRLFGYRWVAGDAATGFHNWDKFDDSCPSPDSHCVSVSAGENSTWRQAPCHRKLQGFVCQSSFHDPCALIQVDGDARVEYTTPTGFDAAGMATFPQGSLAVKTLPDVKHLDSKYICFSGRWVRAPWICDVWQGGCEHGCVSEQQQQQQRESRCTCPTGRPLLSNNITCAEDPCAGCAHQCEKEGDTYACRCHDGYVAAGDGKGCEDVNECEDDENSCTEESQECMNTDGGFECKCRDGFEEEDGECVNIEICAKCEHMHCEKTSGVYGCSCRPGYKVSERDATKCDIHCAQDECPAICLPDTDKHQCYCAEGYIQDPRDDNTTMCIDIDECENDSQCEHRCVNTFGSYRCLCDEGFEPLDDGHRCEGEDGSGSAPPHHVTTPTSIRPDPVPSYLKAGSILGIAAFMALCAGLLVFLIHYALKRCGRFDLASIRSDVDIFHLQQVTTEKYKKFSFDKQWKNDSQRL
ncbi:thrombomodulin-like [Diretmus argenteus]